VLRDQALNLLGVALMNLWSDLVANEVIEVFNFLENSTLQLGFSARALRQLILAIVIVAPASARLLLHLFYDGDFLLQNLLDID